jgi:hypothetical protein
VPFEAPRATIDISVRPIAERDLPKLLDASGAELSNEERWLLASRKRLVEAGFGTCFVAVTTQDEPCYTQWLFGQHDNDDLQSYFSGNFPLLAAGEALLESAFTPVAFRGKRIMPAAMARIAERAADLGARWVLTFVGVDNVPSLKGCAGAGFHPYARCTQEWRLFRCRTIVRPVETPDASSTKPGVHYGVSETRGERTAEPAPPSRRTDVRADFAGAP